jgi:hypothetical protein
MALIAPSFLPAGNLRIGLGIRHLSFALDILHTIDGAELVAVGIRYRPAALP